MPVGWACRKGKKSFMLLESLNASYLLMNLSLYANFVLMLYNPFVSLPFALFNTGMILCHLYLADHPGISERATQQYEVN